MKLLIAEDEKNLNEVITKKLKHEGFGVDSCFDGNEALDSLLYTNYGEMLDEITDPLELDKMPEEIISEEPKT